MVVFCRRYNRCEHRCHRFSIDDGGGDETKREIERALGIGWISERIERLVVAPDWFSFFVAKIFQFFLAWGVLLLGFGFAPAVVAIFLLDFFDGTLISGRIGKAEGGLYLKYRVADSFFDFIVLLPLWYYAWVAYPILGPLFSIWMVLTPLFCIGGLIIADSLLFKPPSVTLLVLAVVGFIPSIIGLTIALNCLLEWWIHGDQFRARGLKLAALILAAGMFWGVFAWLIGLGSLGIIAAIIPP